MPEIFFLEEISGDDVNPYEAVRLASKEARRINQARLMVEVADDAEKPTTLALRRLSEKKIRLSYEGGNEEGSDNAASARKAGSAGR
jgi:DNA-directed RNA polymerase subunit K/omega